MTTQDMKPYMFCHACKNLSSSYDKFTFRGMTLDDGYSLPYTNIVLCFNCQRIMRGSIKL